MKKILTLFVLALLCSSVSAVQSYNYTANDLQGNETTTTSSIPVISKSHMDFGDATRESNIKWRETLSKKYNISFILYSDYDDYNAYFLHSAEFATSVIPRKYIDFITRYDDYFGVYNSNDDKCDEVMSACTWTLGEVDHDKKTYKAQGIIYVNESLEDMEYTLVHEFGHLIYDIIDYYDELAGTRIIATLQDEFKTINSKYGNDAYISNDSKTDSYEDFAEIFANYMIDTSGKGDLKVQWNNATKAKADYVMSTIDSTMDIMAKTLQYDRALITADTAKSNTTTTTDTTKTTNTKNSDAVKVYSKNDLMKYSAMNMNVYSNSRVTSIKEGSNNSFTINGYMFEGGKDATKSLWREIVFVNVNDASSEFAYRKKVTPVYNTWLNSNKLATDNYKHDLSYANYQVSVNPNAMYAYSDGNNKHPVSMKSGKYFIYMRISNGKESYLFPLVDRQLSDGSTLNLGDKFSRVEDNGTYYLVLEV